MVGSSTRVKGARFLKGHGVSSRVTEDQGWYSRGPSSVENLVFSGHVSGLNLAPRWIPVHSQTPAAPARWTHPGDRVTLVKYTEKGKGQMSQ